MDSYDVIVIYIYIYINNVRYLGFVTVHRDQSVKKNQQDATIRCLLSTSVSTCFGHNYAHLHENKDRVLLHTVYWLVAVVGRCVVGCEDCSHPTTQRPTTATNQYTVCSNTRCFFSWRWTYLCPKHVEIEVDNKHLIVAFCWFFLSLQTLRFVWST